MPAPRQYNEYRVEGDTAIVTCSYKGVDYEVLVDIEDWELLRESHGRWVVDIDTRNGRINGARAKSFSTKKRERMHSVILRVSEGNVPDHIDGNTLDNRRRNLREVSPTINARNLNFLRKNNTSGHTGVSWDKSREKWIAQISVCGKVKKVGTFTHKEDAIKARKDAEIEYWGEER